MIRPLIVSDISAALGLSLEAGWNQTADDWRMLLELCPAGCLGINCDGRLAATTTLIRHGRDPGWIGMVLTDREYRRRGLARTLVSGAIALAEEWGIATLKLDATDQGRPLYEALGFRAETPIERWGGFLPGGSEAATPTSIDFALDRRAFGADRSEALRMLARRANPIAAPGGYLLHRPGAHAGFIGPCIAQDPDTARGLIAQLSGGEYLLDILPENREAVRLARELGLEPRRRLLRMVRGPERPGDISLVYAAGGFEIG